MKCPKCGYVSFDYNLTCPKCEKDISSEQEKLHLPSFRPEPPSLLGALTGEANDSRSEMGGGSSEIDLARDAEISFDEESSHFDSGEVAVPDSADFDLGSDEISFEDTSGLSADSGKSSSDDIFGSDIDTEEAIADLELGGLESKETGLDTGELELEDSESAGSLEEDLSLDLGEAPNEEGSLDLNDLDPGGGKEGEPLTDRIATGELQLDGESTEELDNLLDMDEISLEEVPLAQKAPAAKKAKAKKASPARDSDLTLDLEDLDLELDLEDSKPQG
jgi:hypothetical protein